MRSRSLFTTSARATDADVVITEIGGTIGDIESQPFLEAIRQVRTGGRAGTTALFIHVTLVPYLQELGRAQDRSRRSTPSKNCRAMGITARHHRSARRRTVSTRASVKRSRCSAMSSRTASSRTSTIPVLYEAPLMLEKAQHFIGHRMQRAAVLEAPAPRPRGLDRRWLTGFTAPERECDHRAGRQVCTAARRVSFGSRGAAACGLCLRYQHRD